MSVIQVPNSPNASDTPRTVKPWQPFALGFRPFFLLAGLAACLLMLQWIFFWSGLAVGPWSSFGYYGAVGWHSHEMLFGYATAVIGGFLLTAVRNWTGQPTPTGATLAGLAAVWLIGRLLPWIPGVPAILIALVDLAFLPLLAVALVKPLWNGKLKLNRIFVPLLLAMALANGLVHAEALGWPGGWAEELAASGNQLMIDLIVLLLILVAGRVVPFFAKNAVAGAAPIIRSWVETTGFALMPLLALLHLVGLQTAAAPIGFALSALQFYRLAGWHHPGVWRVPVLWVLYVGYIWLALGLLLIGLSDLELLPRATAVHALTVGAIGTFTLGMMARVSLGHTGRSIETSPSINTTFVLINAGALARVADPWLSPHFPAAGVIVSGGLWVLAFVVFLFGYAPILLRARVDGRPG